MRCIVTGGAGFIGSNLVDNLIDDGHEVIIFDDLSSGSQYNINKQAKFFKLDISNEKAFSNPTMKDVMTGVDVMFHTAALARVQPSIDDPIKFHNVNVNGTLNLLKACVDFGINRFVFSSSSSVYGDTDKFPTPEDSSLNPISPYALHKLIGEQYCKLFSEIYDLETVSLRYFNVYGERQPIEGAYTLVMGVFARQMLEGKPMTIRGDGEQRRDFTYVGDVVDANIRAGFYEHPMWGEVFNVGNGDNRSVNEIADLMDGETITVDPVIEPKITLADNKQLKEKLGWKPTIELEDWLPKWKESLGL